MAREAAEKVTAIVKANQAKEQEIVSEQEMIRENARIEMEKIKKEGDLKVQELEQKTESAQQK